MRFLTTKFGVSSRVVCSMFCYWQLNIRLFRCQFKDSRRHLSQQSKHHYPISCLSFPSLYFLFCFLLSLSSFCHHEAPDSLKAVFIEESQSSVPQRSWAKHQLRFLCMIAKELIWCQLLCGGLVKIPRSTFPRCSVLRCSIPHGAEMCAQYWEAVWSSATDEKDMFILFINYSLIRKIVNLVLLHPQML